MIIIVITTVLQKVGLDEICRNGIRDTAHSSHTQPNSPTKKIQQHFLCDNPFCILTAPRSFSKRTFFTIILPFLSSLAKVANPDPPPAATIPFADFWQFFFIAKSFWAWSQSLLVNILILIIILAWLWHLTVFFPKEKKTNILEWYISNTNHKKLGIKAKINQNTNYKSSWSSSPGQMLGWLQPRDEVTLAARGAATVRWRHSITTPTHHFSALESGSWRTISFFVFNFRGTRALS